MNEMRFGVRLVSTTAFALLAAITGALMMVGCPQTPAPGTSFRDCSNGCPEMVVVQQGSFTMGAPAGEEARENLPIERRGRSVPQHLVTIRHKLAIAKFHVTRDEYAQFVAETNRPDPDSCTTNNASGGFIATNGNWHSPGFPQTGRDPVVCVSWDDAQAYVAWLSAKTGHVYRLPTEAEWEYAARANAAPPAPQAVAWFGLAQASDVPSRPQAVGMKAPNAWGLFDMLGNVAEWCQDWYAQDYQKNVRGGSWLDSAKSVRVSARGKAVASTRDWSIGMRIVRVPKT